MRPAGIVLRFPTGFGGPFNPDVPLGESLARARRIAVP